MGNDFSLSFFNKFKFQSSPSLKAYCIFQIDKIAWFIALGLCLPVLSPDLIFHRVCGQRELSLLLALIKKKIIIIYFSSNHIYLFIWYCEVIAYSSHTNDAFQMFALAL